MGLRALSAAALLFSVVGVASAGRPCEPADPDVNQQAQALTMADVALTSLEALGAAGDEVVLIARAGQDLSQYGLTYSHLAFAVREHPAGAWSVVHKLNSCGTDSSDVYDEGLLNFFSDSPFRYQAGIWRLAPALQLRLKAALLGPNAKVMLEPKYSLVAYPFSTRYQNSNGWVLETLASAMNEPGALPGRPEAQAWLRQEGYAPTELKVGAVTRLGGRMTQANIAFDDHPAELRWSGRIRTVTVDSITGWLGTRGAGCRFAGCPELRIMPPGG